MPDVADAGAAWFERSTEVGVVRACFSTVSYVDFGGDLLAVGDPSIPSGPVHLRVTRLPPFVAGQEVEVAVTAERRWRPPAVDPCGLAAQRDLISAMLHPAASPFDPVLTADVRSLLEAGDLGGVARLIGGRGPGLTPTGDDVLAGILVADALGLNRFRPIGRRKAATSVATTDVSRAFLRWAAAGQSIEPVHRLLGSLAAGDPVGARRALRDVRAVGGSSGSDLVYGLRLGLATGQRSASTLTTSRSGPRASVFET